MSLAQEIVKELRPMIREEVTVIVKGMLNNPVTTRVVAEAGVRNVAPPAPAKEKKDKTKYYASLRDEIDRTYVNKDRTKNVTLTGAYRLIRDRVNPQVHMLYWKSGKCVQVPAPGADGVTHVEITHDPNYRKR